MSSPRLQAQAPSLTEGAAGGDHYAGASTEHEGKLEIMTRGEAVFGGPIVGAALFSADEHGPLSHRRNTVGIPRQMTPAERAKPNLAHVRYHPGCPVRASIRRPDTPHVAQHEHLRVVPMLVANNCFMKSCDEAGVQPISVMRLYTCKRYSPTGIPTRERSSQR